MSTPTTALNMRIPIELKQWLNHQAIDNRRTLTSEILIRLEASRRTEEAAASKP